MFILRKYSKFVIVKMLLKCKFLGNSIYISNFFIFEITIIKNVSSFD